MPKSKQGVVALREHKREHMSKQQQQLQQNNAESQAVQAAGDKPALEDKLRKSALRRLKKHRRFEEARVEVEMGDNPHPDSSLPPPAKLQKQAKDAAKALRSDLYHKQLDEMDAMHPTLEDDTPAPPPARPSRRSGLRKPKTEAQVLKGKAKKLSRKEAKASGEAGHNTAGAHHGPACSIAVIDGGKCAPSSASTSSLSNASNGATSRTRLPLLVLLDLNGVLVHRACSGAPFTVRPGALDLLSALGGHVELGFCTSMRYDNAKRAIGAIRSAAFAAEDSIAKDVLFRVSSCHLVFAGDDFHFRNDVGLPILPLRVPSLEPWRMLRNLALIWKSGLSRGHTAQSTILCDDTVGKCPLTPENVVLVPSWDGAAKAGAAVAVEAKAEEDAACHSGDDVLHSLAAYLLNAAKAQADGGEAADVRTYLRAFPFAGGGRSTTNFTSSDAGLE